MRRILTAALGTMLSVCAAGARAQKAVQAPAENEWAALMAANNLTEKGNSPFHLAMTVQLYNMGGKPTRTGTVELWWAAPGLERVVVRLEGVHEDGSLAAGASHDLVRDRYLVNELLNLAVHPVPELAAGRERVKTEKAKFGKVRMNCLGPEPLSGSGSSVQVESVCLQPQTELVLIRRGYSGDEVLTRESTGVFQKVHAALKLQLAFMGRNAIVGDVAKLEGFDVTKLEVALVSLSPQQKVMPAGPMHTDNEMGVVTGKSISRTQPELPNGHREGKAIAQVTVGKGGAVLDVVPIACLDTIYCSATLEALEQWKYTPNVLNGQPVDVAFTISIDTTSGMF
jgi:hypothetical protein